NKIFLKTGALAVLESIREEKIKQFCLQIKPLIQTRLISTSKSVLDNSQTDNAVSEKENVFNNLNLLTKGVSKKIIIVLGGSISGLGKGVLSASIRKLIGRGSIYKIDPYLNIDSSQMTPNDHGEVFVTADGSELDLDFGTYQRIGEFYATRKNHLTTGKVFKEILHNIENFKYLGQTIQINPHVAEIVIKSINSLDADYVIVEMGGTIGDDETLMYYDVFRKLKKAGALFVSLDMIIKTCTGELKTKLVQRSYNSMLSGGFPPDIMVLRSELSLPANLVAKIIAKTQEKNVINLPNVDDLFQCPNILQKQGMLDIINNHFCDNLPQIPVLPPLVTSGVLRIAIIGKYEVFDDVYKSVVDTMNIAQYFYGVKIEVPILNAENIKTLDFDGVIIPGGFGHRNTEEKIEIINRCREQKIPTLGICFGLQLALIELMRNVGGFKNINTHEVSGNKDDLFIPISNSFNVVPNYICLGDKDIRYEGEYIKTRHRHRYMLNLNFLPQLEKLGAEVISHEHICEKEIPETFKIGQHFIGTQGHPELSSTKEYLHPIFETFFDMILNNKTDNHDKK
ncbi:CTP synthase, partial [Cucumispora dikerogammari]